MMMNEWTTQLHAVADAARQVAENWRRGRASDLNPSMVPLCEALDALDAMARPTAEDAGPHVSLTEDEAWIAAAALREWARGFGSEREERRTRRAALVLREKLLSVPAPEDLPKVGVICPSCRQDTDILQVIRADPSALWCRACGWHWYTDDPRAAGEAAPPAWLDDHAPEAGPRDDLEELRATGEPLPEGFFADEVE